MNVIIISDVRELDSLIKSIKLRGAKLDKAIHQACVSALSHAEQHGDSTYCTRVVDAISKGGRRNAVASWFQTFGTLVWNNAEKKFQKGGERAYDVQEGMRTPFWKLKGSEGGEVKPFSESEDLAKVIGYLTSHEKLARENGAGSLAHNYKDVLDILSKLMPASDETEEDLIEEIKESEAA